MSDFEDRLNSILNDPAQMEKITSMAKSLMGSQQESAPEPPKAQTGSSTGLFDGLDPAMLRLTGALQSMNQPDEKQALLSALQPYLSPKRQEKLERAMKLAQMIHMAEIAFGMFGGGDNAKI